MFRVSDDPVAELELEPAPGVSCSTHLYIQAEAGM